MSHIDLKSVLDYIGRVFNKANSRKFLVWVVATIALFTHFIPAEYWMPISMLYMGAEWALDWKGLTGSGIVSSRAQGTGAEVSPPVNI